MSTQVTPFENTQVTPFENTQVPAFLKAKGKVSNMFGALARVGYKVLSIKSKVFTTLPGVGPPVDAEIDTTTVDFTFPDPPDGTPGAVGSAFCWWEYGFQVFEGSTGNGYVDIGSLTEVAGDVGDVTIDLNGLPFSSYESGSFRMRYREVCNGVDGAWLYGDAFMKYDLDVLCGGLTQSESAADLPYSNADMFSIVPCMNTGHWLKQRDGVSARLSGVAVYHIGLALPLILWGNR